MYFLGIQELYHKRNAKCILHNFMIKRLMKWQKNEVNCTCKDLKLLNHIKFSINKIWKLTNVNIFLPRWTTFKYIVVLCAFKELLWHKFAVIKFCSFQKHESAADRISLVLCDSKSIQIMLIEYLWWCNKISFYVISHAVQNINDRKLGPYMKWIGKRRTLEYMNSLNPF